MLLVILAPAAQAATVSNHAEVSATEISGAHLATLITGTLARYTG
jgi:hypothetical protein